MVGWHHQLSGHKFEKPLGDSEGQRILACCIPWAHKESDTPEQPNNNKGGKKEKHQLWVEFLLTFCIDWIIAMGDNN